MRILLLSTSMGLGGADKQILLIANELRRRGHAILIVSLTPLGPMGEEARSLGIPIESLQMRRGVPDPRGLARLIQVVRTWRPDVVHSHMIHANLLARALRLLVRVPALVSTIHSTNEGGGLRMAAYRLTNRLIDRATIVSEAAGERYVREGIIPAELLTVIPNGVDLSDFRSATPEARDSLRRTLQLGPEFVWLAVGRFQLAKDYPNMLRAFVQVRTRYPQAVLLLVGRGPLQGECETLAQSLGIAGGVRFLGVRHDVPELMSAADGYVMSSSLEGMPVVLLEAAAAGLPIVATAVGGNGEVIRDGESGFLVTPGDAEALGSAMVRLMGLSQTERKVMGEAGRTHIRMHYSLGRAVDRWEALYQEVLARRGLALVSTLSP